MYLWTRKEIAEGLGVSPNTPHYWIHNWGPDSTHPFPEPIARIQQQGNGPRAHWGLRQLAYDPGAVQQWHVGLAAAKGERMSLAQTGTTRSSKRNPTPMSNLQIAVEAVAELRSAMAVLVATRSELVALREEVGRA